MRASHFFPQPWCSSQLALAFRFQRALALAKEEAALVLAWLPVSVLALASVLALRSASVSASLLVSVLALRLV
jgi:hypothetical protein